MKNHTKFGVVGTGLMPTVDARVPEWLNKASRIGHALSVTDLLVTFTSDETGAYFFNAPEHRITEEQLQRLDYP